MRALIGLLVLAVVGLSGRAAAKPGGRGGVSPAVGESLSAEHTVAVGGIGHLDRLAERGLVKSSALPAGHVGSPPSGLDRGRWAEVLGFDPGTAAGWRAAGIDPKAGVTFVVDARLVADGEPVPVLLLKVTDRDALLRGIERAVGVRPTIRTEDGVEVLTLRGEAVLFGRKGEWTAVLLAVGGQRARARSAFGGFLADSSPPLSGATAWRSVFADGRGAVDLFAYVGVRSLGRLWVAADGPAGAGAEFDFFAERFPSFGVSMTRAGGAAVRLTATDEGRSALRQMLQPKRAPPRFSRYLPPQGWAGIRLSVNVTEVFEGLAALVPPTASPDFKSKLALDKAAMAAAVGVQWDAIGKAFPGHMVFMTNQATLAETKADPLDGEWVVMLAAGDAAASDALVGSLVAKANASDPGLLVPTALAGARGWRVDLGPKALVAVRDRDVWLLGDESVVARLVAPRKHRPSRVATRALDGADVAFGFWADLQQLLEEWKADPVAPNAFGKRAWRRFAKEPGVSLTWRLDRGGLVAGLDSALPLQEFATMVASWSAAPALLEAINQAKTHEARINMRRLYEASVAYYHQDRVGPDGTPLLRAFPPSVPLTPAADRCATGDHAYAPDAAPWQHRGWRALNFSVDDPHYYRYEFISSGTGRDAMFTARAVGDLDCDGVYSTFERTGTIDAEDNVTGGVGLRVVNELE